MRSCYIGPARSQQEVAFARELAAHVFSAMHGGSGPDTAEHKHFLWDEPGFPGSEHIVVACGAAGDVLAAVRLLPRSLRRGQEKIPVAGISSVCVVESHRGCGLGREIMEAALHQGASLGYELTVLFARRAVDRLYPRFDIWGLASYTSLRFKLDKSTSEPLTTRHAAKSDIPQLVEDHEVSYARCFGWLDRTEAHWSFLLAGAPRRQLSVFIIETGGSRVGYAVLSGDHVVELGVSKAAAGLDVFRALPAHRASQHVVLPPLHVALPCLEGLDLTVSSRVCEYGGHMVGILDRARARDRLAERVRRHALELRLGPTEENVDGITVRWTGTAATVELNEVNAAVLGLRTTARLVGASLADRHEESVLAPGAPLDFLKLDEF
jgi:GNAT superfamily N-acetyltransferase